MAVTDTTARAAALQLELYKAAGPAGRVRIAVELSDAVRDTALAGIRRRQPDLSQRELSERFVALVYGVGKDR